VNSGKELEIYTTSSLKSTQVSHAYLRKNKTHQEIIQIKLVWVNKNA